MRPIIVCPATDETRARVAAAWSEYEAAIADGSPADVWDKAVIDRVIHALAQQGRPFSANDFRELLPQVRTALISRRLIVAQNDGVIRRVGKTPSTLKSTHGHDINVYAPTRAHSLTAPAPEGDPA